MRLETARLILRQPNHQDCNWIFALNHDPLWLRFIGNRGVHTLRDARRYVDNILQHFEQNTYGLLVIQCKFTGRPFGLCGLIKRDFLSVPDLGFALLPQARGQGIGKEAAQRVIACAEDTLRVSHLSAMTHVENTNSKALLLRLGFTKQGIMFSSEGLRQILFLRRCEPDI
ncbi:GNAT family N-acetyltransferase [Aestuariibacter sp. A3R04]|uniref:GNAT family N-acetyltransferase n=1 Tax=Aestuariibacter sp. A3R04 TaxID=2841571 RepID=UPI001C0A4991|nr:GNAT family N-acetyltransferase [Aestuariibacter sp. A3R04]